MLTQKPVVNLAGSQGPKACQGNRKEVPLVSWYRGNMHACSAPPTTKGTSSKSMLAQASSQLKLAQIYEVTRSEMRQARQVTCQVSEVASLCS